MDDVLSKRRPADGDNPPVTTTVVTALFTQRGLEPAARRCLLFQLIRLRTLLDCISSLVEKWRLREKKRENKRKTAANEEKQVKRQQNAFEVHMNL